MEEVKRLLQYISSSTSSKLRLLFFYRYSSLVLTSIFYLIGPQSPLLLKVIVVVSLGLAAAILTDIQRKYLENHSILKSTVLAETIGLTLLLIPTGGVSSPFIWYAVNPVLVASSFLSAFFCWGALTFFLGSATCIAYYLLNINNMLSILEDKSYFYLVCFLMTLLARLFSGLTKELDLKASLLKEQQEELLQINETLTNTNEKYQQTLEHVMSLYHLMETFASQKNPNKVAEEVISSLMTCTQSEAAFFWLTNLNHQESYIANTTKNNKIETDLKNDWNHIRGKKSPFIRKINHELYWMKIIRTSNNVGVLGAKINSFSDVSKTNLLSRSFEFFAELSEIMLERIHMDQIMEQMLVIDEQNRIANEIHDSVSQRLFGMVCALHSLQVKGRNLTWEELNYEFQFLSQSANTTMKELRSAIYRLSSVKKGEKPFLVQLKKYLDDFSKLNNVKVSYQITGDETYVSDKLKQSLYRIICEACGNSIKHGQCNLIELTLAFFEDKTILVIHDDGIGIQLSTKSEKTEKGIGLFNMQSMVRSFSGTFSIQGAQGKGTEIKIEFPTFHLINEQEVAG